MKQFYVQDTSSQVAGQVCPGDHKAMQPIAIAFDCPLKLNGKTSLIKTSHTLFTRHGGIRLVLTKKKLPHCWVSFKLIEGVILNLGVGVINSLSHI